MSVLTSWLFKIDTLLSLCWVIVRHNQVLTRRAVEKDRIPDALLHGFARSKIMTFITSEIANLLCIQKFLTAGKISSDNNSFVFSIIVWNKPSCASNTQRQFCRRLNSHNLFHLKFRSYVSENPAGKTLVVEIFHSLAVETSGHCVI